MNFIFLISVILKGIGALLEILLQILITKEIGVSGYGTYATWINAADLLFWILFSGVVKCNTFYLSDKSIIIGKFKRKYYGFYVLPFLAIATIAAIIITKTVIPCFVLIIVGLELLVLDYSSTLIARGKPIKSLVGEYMLGRLVLVIGIVLLRSAGCLHVHLLVMLYIIQYVMILLFFLIRSDRREVVYNDISKDVSLKKWGAYQRADLMHSMIEQMPVVLQYFFSGAFEAGVVSVILLVKKLIGFISGPTAKIFLPEFSRLYHAGDNQKIRSSYASIMRIQMLVVGPLAVVLLGYPRVVLKILASELIQYTTLFMMCATIFLLVATLGPCGGILQMTGNEKKDNRCREIALVVMCLVMILTHKDPYFVLYGLCVQVALEAVMKYSVVCRWMKKTPISLCTYLKWWIIPCVLIGITYLFSLQNSFEGMILTAGMVFAVSLIRELRCNESDFWNKLKRKPVDTIDK